MIPTMLVVGLLLGRLWAIPLGGVAWAALVVLVGDCGWDCLPLAALLGAANTAAGVAVHFAIRLPLRAFLRRG